MSGPFEKYVARAAEALAKSTAHVAPTTHPWEGMSKSAKERNEIHAAAVLAAVGPLIQEDTRDRMVTAAAASLDRDGGDGGMLAGVRKLHAADFVPQPSQFHAWCTECNCPWPCATAKILDAEPESAPPKVMTAPNEEYGLRPCCPSPIAGPHTLVCLVGRGVLVDPEATP